MNTMDRAATFTRLDGAQFGPMDDLESVLDKVNAPAQVRALSRAQLKQLSAELREFLLRSVASTGGICHRIWALWNSRWPSTTSSTCRMTA